MGTCLPAVTEALAATPGVASSAGKTWPYWQIPQSACSVTRGYGFHTVEVNHTQGSKSDTPPCHAMASTCVCDSLHVPSRMLGGDLLVFLVALSKNARHYACGAAARVLVVTLGLDAVRFLPIMYVMRRLRPVEEVVAAPRKFRSVERLGEDVAHHVRVGDQVHRDHEALAQLADVAHPTTTIDPLHRPLPLTAVYLG